MFDNDLIKERINDKGFINYLVSEYQLDLDLLDEISEQNFDHKFWSNVSIVQNLSEDFINKYITRIDWYYISKYQSLSENFIEKYITDNTLIAINNQNISKEFYNKKYNEYVRNSNNNKTISNAYLLTPEEIKAILKEYFLSSFKFYDDYFIGAIMVDNKDTDKNNFIFRELLGRLIDESDIGKKIEMSNKLTSKSIYFRGLNSINLIEDVFYLVKIYYKDLVRDIFSFQTRKIIPILKINKYSRYEF